MSMTEEVKTESVKSEKPKQEVSETTQSTVEDLLAKIEL